MIDIFKKLHRFFIRNRIGIFPILTDDKIQHEKRMVAIDEVYDTLERFEKRYLKLINSVCSRRLNNGLHHPTPVRVVESGISHADEAVFMVSCDFCGPKIAHDVQFLPEHKRNIGDSCDIRKGKFELAKKHFEGWLKENGYEVHNEI